MPHWLSKKPIEIAINFFNHYFSTVCGGQSMFYFDEISCAVPIQKIGTPAHKAL